MPALHINFVIFLVPKRNQDRTQGIIAQNIKDIILKEIRI